MKNRLLWMGCLSYVMTGVTLVIVGAVLPELLAHYSLTYSEGSVLIFIQFLGLQAGVLGMPALSRKLSRKKAIIAGLLLISSELFISALPAWPIVVLFAGMAGFGAGLVESIIGTVILLAFKHKQAIAMSKLEVTFGIGALTMPFIAGFLIAEGIWTYAFLILGISSITMAALWMRLPLGEIHTLLSQKDTKSLPRPARPAYAKHTLPFIAMCGVFAFLYGGSEVSVVQFFPSIFMERWRIDSSLAASTVSIFWLAMVVGRIFCGVLAEKLGYYRFLGVSTVCSMLILFAFPFIAHAWGGFALCLLLGLFMAGMYAVALIYANAALHGMTEQTTSVILGATGLGGSVLPLAVGWMMDTFPAQMVFWLLFAVMSAMLLLLYFTKRSIPD